MTDELERRLRSADPAPAPRQGQPVAPWIRDLVEETMTITNERADERAGGRPGQRSRWLAVAACGAAAVALSGGLYASMQDPGAPSAKAPPPAVELTLNAEPIGQSCLPFSVDQLKAMPLAFSGTVVRLEDGTVRLTVDRWYRGGTSPEVLLKAPAGDDVALVGAVTFEQGKRYLVTASEGIVGSCGLTTAWDPQMEAAFQEAFAT
jgi:hypothetical protein